jgi:hypothetical protein
LTRALARSIILATRVDRRNGRALFSGLRGCFLLLDAVSVTNRMALSPEIGFRLMARIIEQEVSVLLTSKHGLLYLTANDWALVIDKASRVQFKQGAILIQKGKRANGVYLLVKGSARVVIPSQASRTLGPGEICGEMSFLEETPASASVIADADVEAFHLDRATLQSVFELYPHLGSRFYRSVATNLSHRLREAIAPTSRPPTDMQKTAPDK